NDLASVGDRVTITLQHGAVGGEIVGLAPRHAEVLPEGMTEGLSVGAEVELLFAPRIAPCDGWIGRIVDPLGQPLDGRPLPQGDSPRAFRAEAPPAVGRKRLGARLPTGLAVFDTL
ncbi:MAG: flagellum-specific ATP synthase FliI, partial [Pararhodobacter sp.]